MMFEMTVRNGGYVRMGDKRDTSFDFGYRWDLTVSTGLEGGGGLSRRSMPIARVTGCGDSRLSAMTRISEAQSEWARCCKSAEALRN
jgi:hypothetical protein